ncbi:hypothetical protein RF11_16313 [Thelohanellus kitauei]|uniref:Uncharacterized protein n=1 Tax=Thelohanellus kitauei TaxID=669202 RepID=A0A0C2N1Y7_THEKT|nr:hypothetical protein RF11_16313 [Thelohanellus kitauei]
MTNRCDNLRKMLQWGKSCIIDVHESHVCFRDLKDLQNKNIQYLDYYVFNYEAAVFTTFMDAAKKSSIFDPIQHYDMLLKDKHCDISNTTVNQFMNILRLTLLSKEKNITVWRLTASLRFMFYSSCMNTHFSDADFEMIMKRLIYLALEGKEPLATYAIKCLQVFVSNRKRLENFYPQLKQLFDVLICRLLKYIHIYAFDRHQVIRSVTNEERMEMDDFNRSMILSLLNSVDTRDLIEYQSIIEFNSIVDLLDESTISKPNKLKYHYLALIRYLISIYDVSLLII